jgi:thiol-disulfide isomerase/thioredoxin
LRSQKPQPDNFQTGPTCMKTIRPVIPLTFVLFIVGWVLLAPQIIYATSIIPSDSARTAPEFAHQNADAWINSLPLSIQQLRNKVVLLDFWTFGCWNCYRSFPWLNELEARYHEQDLQIIGVHTPEFAHEKVRSKVAAKVKEFNLQHPVMMDNDFQYWNAMNNRYWPAFYLLDKQGRIRASFYGETHSGDAKARAIQQIIEQLLAE